MTADQKSRVAELKAEIVATATGTGTPDAAALRNYTESYVYNKVGNMLSTRHEAGVVD